MLLWLRATKTKIRLAYMFFIWYLCNHFWVYDKMPTDKNQIIRYQTLDRCFADRTRYYFWEDLREKCIKALEREGVQYPDVSRRTIYNDIAAMEGNTNWNVLFEKPGMYGRRRYYRYADPNYSIWNYDLNEEQLNQLKSILIMLRQFQGLPQYERLEEIIEQLQTKYGFTLADTESIICFDTNPYVKGIEYLNPLFNAIVNKQCLRITYQPYGLEPYTRTMHPYYIKQYNGRWFLLGLAWREGELNITNFALDRIVSIEPSATAYIPNKIDFEDYFDDLIGVTRLDCEPIKVLLAFSKTRFPYILSKPLHGSQKTIDREHRQVQIEVKPSRELYQQLLSFGPDVEVLSPDFIRDEIMHRIGEMQNLYK